MALQQLVSIQQDALAALEKVDHVDSLENWRIEYLGRSSKLMGSFDQLGQLPKEERPAIGRQANQVKQLLEEKHAEKVEFLKQAELQRSLESEQFDVTLPGRRLKIGRLHPITQTLRVIYQVFADMGFQVYRSREVETDELNFELLNIPAHHPARDMWDTFHTTSPGILLRTHTSPVQVRVMESRGPPVKVVAPGKVYRCDSDLTHTPMFNQVEGLAIEENITMGDLKGTLSDFARRMFGQNVRTRFRAAHFPFTEPSAEMDVECFLCGGQGCAVCKGTGWLEILGCGMVHPTVLRNGGYDPQKYTGFAFGMGSERITMLRHHIEDIRYFWANDLRFLEQF